MSTTLSIVDWAVCGTAVFIIVLAIYTHVEGNRLSAIKFAYDDISREMGAYSRTKVWWRAINIAMGWQTKRGMAQQRNVNHMRKVPQS